MNENGESFKSYDISIKRKRELDIYVEVKATINRGPCTFAISRREWDEARKFHEKELDGEYHIYAVFDVGKETSQIGVLKNPFEKFLKGELDAEPLGLKLYPNETTW